MNLRKDHYRTKSAPRPRHLPRPRGGFCCRSRRDAARDGPRRPSAAPALRAHGNCLQRDSSLDGVCWVLERERATACGPLSTSRLSPSQSLCRSCCRRRAERKTTPTPPAATMTMQEAGLRGGRCLTPPNPSGDYVPSTERRTSSLGGGRGGREPQRVDHRTARSPARSGRAAPDAASAAVSQPGFPSTTPLSVCPRALSLPFLPSRVFPEGTDVRVRSPTEEHGGGGGQGVSPEGGREGGREEGTRRRRRRRRGSGRRPRLPAVEPRGRGGPPSLTAAAASLLSGCSDGIRRPRNIGSGGRARATTQRRLSPRASVVISRRRPGKLRIEESVSRGRRSRRRSRPLPSRGGGGGGRRGEPRGPDPRQPTGESVRISPADTARDRGMRETCAPVFDGGLQFVQRKTK